MKRCLFVGVFCSDALLSLTHIGPRVGVVWHVVYTLFTLQTELVFPLKFEEKQLRGVTKVH